MTRRQSVRVAVTLWLVLAAVVWNVVFDRMVVLAGRRYSYDAVMQLRATGRYLLLNDAMRPAVAHAAWTAIAVAVVIAAAALLLIRIASSRGRL
jgi:hypothetical protein